MSTIVIAAFNHALPSALMGIADLFALSGLGFVQDGNAHSTDKTQWNPRILIASDDGLPIYDSKGRLFDVDTDFHSIDQCDAVLIPGFTPNNHGHPPSKLISQEAKSWLAHQYMQGALLGGSCSGVFALGEAGLLNNRRCTTTWWLHDELRKRFSKANPVWASDLITDKRVISAGGPLSWVNVTLHIVKELAGNDTSKLMSDFAVVDTTPKSQKLYVPMGFKVSTDPFLAKAEYTIRQTHYQNISSQDLANNMSVSHRTLSRKIKHLTGETPKGFIDRIKISNACTLLKTTDKPIKEIALQLGYSDDTVFRRLFRKNTKMTPTQYKQQLNL
ncbi:MAG: GlxA family transcriptional regulator [Cellvibrionaceae bacterium]